MLTRIQDLNFLNFDKFIAIFIRFYYLLNGLFYKKRLKLILIKTYHMFEV